MLLAGKLRVLDHLRPLLHRALLPSSSSLQRGITQVVSLQMPTCTLARTSRGRVGGAGCARYSSQHSSQEASCSTSLINDTTSLLRNYNNGAEVFLVGTAHVSRASADEVREVIRAVNPSVVMVELCPGRAARLRANASPQPGDFLKELVGHLGMPGFDLGAFLMRLGVSGFYQLLKSVGMDPGLEFKVAMQEAERCNAALVYGDQDVQRTVARLSRGANGLSLPQLMSLLASAPPVNVDMGAGGLAENLERMKTRAAAHGLTKHLRAAAPALAAALVDERDKHMTDVLLQQRGRVVGVVGLAHLDGIERRWEAAMARGQSRHVLPEAAASNYGQF